MKLVLDNIIFSLQQLGGMSVYWSEIVKRLEKIKGLEIQYLEPKGAVNNIFYEKQRLGIKGRIQKEKYRATLLSFMSNKGTKEGKYIFHSSYYRISKSPKAINLVTIHDLIPEMFYVGMKRYYHVLRKKRAIKNASGIVCISMNTYNDLLKHYPFTKDIPTKVIYNGVSDDYFLTKDKALIANLNLPDKYIMFVGKRSEYKNFSFVIELLNNLRGYHLVIVGSQLSDEEKNRLHSSGIKYSLINNPDNATVNQLYNNAFCLLYPSSYEGFGIPVIEAMQAGCPVVALHASSVPEIANGAALLAQALSVKEFTSNIVSLENDEVRTPLISKGIANARNFNWDHSVGQLVSFYKELHFDKTGQNDAQL